MMRNDATPARRVKSRLVSALVSLAMIFSVLGAVAPVRAAAASWMEPYLEKLVSWGVMRGDSSGNLHPDRAITRAEFVALVNRAYGYSEKTAKLPFKDVKPTDWFADDVNIAYTAGYFNGTSKNTASPRSTLTREQATAILGRNMVLDNLPGQSLDFTDSNKLGNYSRGLVRSAVSEGIISGYKDGSFRPKQTMTRGQMAVVLTKAIGTPISKSGDYGLGGVYGNLTISAAGVTLRNTTVAGNLYVTGGVGLGAVTLENVTVLGKIVLCGAGESEKGGNSVVLRNVTAPAMVLDSAANNFVTVRAEGDTAIGETKVRTNSYLEDATDDERGFQSIVIDGEEGTEFSAAGNLKEITTKTPKSVVNIAKGTAQVVNVDEKATESTVNIDGSATVKTLNLDVGTKVTGTGDVDVLNVNAPGSSTSMLPDKIVIRPGLEADINGGKMDSTLAAESSADPRLLSGYPKVTNVAATSATDLSRTNKSGTIYWAVTGLNDGSVAADDLVRPSGDPNILKSGNLNAGKSNTDFTAALSGLDAASSYYLSSMLVDARDQRSPVKVVAFSTPDNTVPAFVAGYPAMTKITKDQGWVTAMTNKDCVLYYALMPKGGAAPSAKDFKTGSLSGNLGAGTQTMTKNESRTFQVNGKALDELVVYDLYLWLTDADGAHSSAVKKLSFTTVDGTPPEFAVEPTITDIGATAVKLTATLKETGTIFWAVVKEGEVYPKAMPGQGAPPALSSDDAKIQVSNGVNALKSGKVSAAELKSAVLNVAGLAAETAYDLYYVAQDKAGNYSAAVGKLPIHTLDENAPAVTQEFPEMADKATLNPRADCSVRIVFSENVQDAGEGSIPFLKLYQDAQKGDSGAKGKLTAALKNDIQLYLDNTTGDPADLVPDRNGADGIPGNADDVADWVIDYSKVTVAGESGKLVVTFPHGTGINLQSGAKYHFHIRGIADTSTAKNPILPQDLPKFTTVFAQVNLTSISPTGVGTPPVTPDIAFRATPLPGGNISENVYYDILLRTTSYVEFQLYHEDGDGVWQRYDKADGSPITAIINPAAAGAKEGVSLSYVFESNSTKPAAFKNLSDFSAPRQFGIVFTRINDDDVRVGWNGKVEMEVRVLAETASEDLQYLCTTSLTDSDLKEVLDRGNTVEIGNPAPYTGRCSFSDSALPELPDGFPEFTVKNNSATMDLQLSRSSGTIYYVVAPLGDIRTVLNDADKTLITADNWATLPQTNATAAPVYTYQPARRDVTTAASTGNVIAGSRVYQGSKVSIPLNDLVPEKEYCAYLVLQGNQGNQTASPYVFRFKTEKAARPRITLSITGSTVYVGSSPTAAVVDYVLVVNGKEPSSLRAPMRNYVSGAEDEALFGPGGAYAGYTALKAMSEDAGDGSGSLFDQYATSNAKKSLANDIRSQQPTGDATVTKKGTISVPGGGVTPVNCTDGLKNNNYYTFLAVGKSSGDGGNNAEDAFRATWSVYLLDQEAPKVSSCVFDGDFTVSGAMTGKLTIGFDKPLYFNSKAGGEQKILPIKSAVTVPVVPGTYQRLDAVFTGGIGYSLVTDGKTVPVQFVTYQLTGARSGSAVRADANLSNEAGITRSPNLTVELNVETDENGKRSVSFVIPAAWDARP